MPQISVVVPSYNHEKYISKALESVARQTFTDYELIISDDASIDRSVDVIEEFLAKHPTIPSRLIKNRANMGGVLNLNQLISQASSKYIAVLNSDDVWASEKLEVQVEYLERHPEVGAVFTQAVIVDEQGVELPKQEYPFSDVFYQQNRSRGEWLRRFFFDQNCLCHPSILIRSEIYSQIGCYDPRYRQIPDFEMWVRLVKHTEIHIIERPMVSLLWHEHNTSSINYANTLRGYHEIQFILRDFFVGIPDEIFIDGFQEFYRKQQAFEPVELACEKAFIFLYPRGPIEALYHNIGLEKLYYLLGDPTAAKTLAKEYQFSYQDLVELNGGKPFESVLFPGMQIPNLGNNSLNETPELSTQMDEAPTSISLKEKIKLVLKKSPTIFTIASIVWRYTIGRFR